MSTRATIKIKDGCEERWVYHHCDGYPEGIGKELKELLSDERTWTAESVFYRMTKDRLYVPTEGEHGDEDYGYLIDCDDRTLVCFGCTCGQLDWSNEVFRESYRANNETPHHVPYAIHGSFICNRCRRVCNANCHEKLVAITEGIATPGSPDYEENKDLIGRKQIISCLGPYCDKPCWLQLDEYTPYRKEDGIRPLIGLINYLGDKVNELLAKTRQ